MRFIRHELRHSADPLDTRHYKGGGGNNSSASPTTTTSNTDRRMALQDAVVLGDGASAGSISRTNYDSTTTIDSRSSDDHSITYAADAEVLKTLAGTLPDAVNFMVNAGADVIKSAGGAVVQLNKDSINANTKSFDKIVDFGAGAIDKIISASVKTSQIGNDLAAKAVASYQPDSKNQADTAKYALYAAAGLVALVLLNNGKKS